MIYSKLANSYGPIDWLLWFELDDLYLNELS